ncbi:tRNA glutamyl-Q(34) synthetase GluQRS [Chitinimonas sp. BJYL2]|uniref:tRNA glutamyl-Q(34) synthetase GluQRS n=1 Tax=Chitinimonas sp. BJYL2 TaxID=2976696 RepID=UPI0022B3D1EF|nr:tRNA glutamyl-Q(34) synthetase GluQRS [Chitinimonas sp. BJYL2]
MVISKDTSSIIPPRYRGRFAPSPTGLLHAGSLLAATASYLDARAQSGEWLLRIEDLDPPREMPGATDGILRTLAAFGFEWDGEVVLQSRRHALYAAALADLQARHLAYGCACTRKEIADTSRPGVDGPVYPGTCRDGVAVGRIARAIRVRVEGVETIQYLDAIQGMQSQNLADQVGDFVLRRADGFYAYQLAVVVDDAEQGITHVVRGADLIDSTPRQIHLQRCLSYPSLQYAHVPVLVNANGEKLSKQTLAPALDPADAGRQLWAAMQALGLSPPPALLNEKLADIWQWAIQNWQIDRVPSSRVLRAEQLDHRLSH